MKELSDYPDYFITSDGVVISRKYKKERILKQQDVNGYKRIRIYGKNIGVHRLVGIAYIENPEQKPFINHLNGDKHDNRAENLEWCTPAENNRHAEKVLGFVRHKIEVKYGRDNHSSKRVAQIGSDGNVIETFDCIRHAAKSLGVKTQGISKVANKNQVIAYGYKWQFV